LFELARSETFLSYRDELLGLFCGHLDGDPRATYMLSAFLDKHRERFSLYSGILAYWLRDIWLSSLSNPNGGNDIKIVNGDMAHKLDKYRALYAQDALLECIIRIDETYAAVSSNANFMLAVNAMLFKINELLNAA
jgi:hypothetical protein